MAKLWKRTNGIDNGTTEIQKVVYLHRFTGRYLEKRFTPGVRSLGCLLFMLQYILYLSVVLYAPSLALQAVAGVPLAASIITTGLVCNFYTTLGGMKAVIWTDVFQASVMVLGLIVVLIVGSIELGGFGQVFDIARKGERMTLFDFNPDPTIRNTFWTLSIGGAFTAMPVWTVSQTAVQRFMSARTFRTLKWAVYLNIPGLMIIVILCVMDGLVIYGVYSDCDLKKDGKVTSNDQVLPYFIINKLGHLKGVPGIFTACLFSGALSTASSGLNSIACVTLEDIVKKVHPNLTDQKATIISKVIACSFGLLIIGGAFLVSFVGTMVLQLAYSIFGIVGGPCLGIFALGMLVPWSTWKGAYGGCLIGVTTTLWLAVGAQVYPPNKHEAPISITGCSDYNATTAALKNLTGIIYNPSKWKPHNVALENWYSVSYLWYAAIGVSFTFVGGCLVSLITGRGDPKDVDPILLFDTKAFLWSFVPRNYRPAGYSLREDKDDYNDQKKHDDIFNFFRVSGSVVLMTLNEKRTEDCAIEKEKEAAKQRERAFSKDSPPPPYENSVNDPPDNIVSIQENHV